MRNPKTQRKFKKLKNNKFITRFSWMEKKIISDGKSINKMTLEEMDKYWERSKKT